MCVVHAGGQRIDAICSQLITSRQHTPTTVSTPVMHLAAAAGCAAQLMHCDNVVVKKELVVDDYTDTSHAQHYGHHHRHHDDYHSESSYQHHVTPRHHVTPPAAAAAADKAPHQSALAALTDWFV